MIRDSLQFIADELNTFLTLKLGPSAEPPRLVLGNVARVFDADTNGVNALNNKAVLSLVNVEEDRVAKQQENFVKSDITTKYKSPPVYLNLYILFASNRTNYDDGLSVISTIIQFFQYQHVFTPITHPALNPKIEKLIVDLYTLNFEQINHLWSVLGGKYLPSALYKVRQVTIDEDIMVGETGFIKEITLNEKVTQPVTS